MCTDIAILVVAADDGIMGCDIIPKVTLDGETVSSTRIREQLASGEFDEALRFLGHPPVYSGVVAHGNRIGTTLAVPTANLPFPDGVLVPARGVYCARVALEGRDYPAVVNIGVHPTAGASERPVLEAWIFDFSGDLYGKQISVWLCGFLRPERTFPSMAKAAKNLTPVTLELGGKSPAIIDDTADVRTAARRVAFGKVLNAGQTCVEPDYAFVREPVVNQFLEAYRAALREFFPDGDYSQMPVIVNQKHYERVKGLLSEGHTIIGGGFDDGTRFIEPTVLMKFVKSSLLVKLVVLILVVYAVVTLVSLRSQIADKNSQAATLTGSIAAAEQENGRLQESIDELDTDTGVEAVARDKLGMVSQGEIVFHDVSD